MKTRQFQQLAGLSKEHRVEKVLEGLQATGANVLALTENLEKCNDARAFRAAQLVYNAGREEAGKFLILIDTWRAPSASQDQISRQFNRAGDHLSKLLYAQMADYSIATQKELLSAINTHRRGLYLDGPNDFDWIFRNDLLTERESAMYVDLVEAEGSLEWWAPRDYGMSVTVPFSMRLVGRLLETDLVTEGGLSRLQEAWADFDPVEDSHCSKWAERNAKALSAFPDRNVDGPRLNSDASFVARRWPMPMVALDLTMTKVTEEEMIALRDEIYESWLRREFGPMGDEDFYG